MLDLTTKDTPKTLRAAKLRPVSSRIVLAALFGLAVIAAPAAAGFLIHKYAVNVPFSDEWDTLDIVIKSHLGQLDFASLWAQQNEHRLLVVNVISVLLAKWTDYNLIVNMYCGLAFEILALLLIWRILKLTLAGPDAILVKPLVICASLLMFWSVSYENWTFAISSVEFLSSVFWAVATVWALSEWRGRWPGLLLASLFAVLGVLTAASGFPLLVIVVLGTLAYGWRRKAIPWAQLGFFVALAGLLLIVFFHGWFEPYNTRGHNPVTLVSYFFAYLGSPFDSRFDWKLALATGVAAVTCTAVCLQQLSRALGDQAESLVPWILLALYSLGNAALTAYGRTEFGLPQAMSSRYTSIALLLWIAAAVLLSMILRRRVQQPRHRRLTILFASLLTIVCLGVYAQAYYKGLGKLRYQSLVMRQGVKYVHNYETVSDNALLTLHPNPSHVREMCRELEQYHLGPFAKPATGD